MLHSFISSLKHLLLFKEGYLNYNWCSVIDFKEDKIVFIEISSYQNEANQI